MRLRTKLSIIAGVAAMTATAGAGEQGRLSIMAVMHKEFTVRKAPLAVVKKEMAAEPPDWEKVRAATGKFVTLAEALAENEPRQGDKESWKRFTDRHKSDVKAMDEGARAGDDQAVRAALRRVANSCKACHDAHRFRRED